MGLNNLGKGFKKALPAIVAACACVGVAATAVTSAKAGMETEKTLRDIKYRSPSTKDKIKMCAKHYILPASLAAGTIMLIITGKAIDKRQRLALTAAYMALNKTYKEYQNEIRREFGDETHQKVLSRIGQEANQVDSDDEMYGMPCNTAFDLNAEEPRTFYDEWSGQYFQASPEQVYRAELILNHWFAKHGYVRLSKWYELLGIDPKKDISGLVWTCEDDLLWINFINSCTKTDDGFECWTIGFAVDPYPDPGYFY